ncbi:MAG: sialidase family protein [Chloroflexia bacterium]
MDLPTDQLRRRQAQLALIPAFLSAVIVLSLTTNIVELRANSAQTSLFEVRVNQTTRADQHEPSLAVHPSNPNIVIAAAKDWRTGPKQVWYYRSTDGGRTWADGHINSLPSELPNQSDPVVSFDAAGTAYLTVIAYNQNDLSVGGIFVARSTDAGLTWQKPVRVAANSEDVFNDKEWVGIDRSGNRSTRGNIYVTWTLFSEDGPRRDRGDIVVSRSTDGGLSFSSPRPVSPIEHSTNQGSYPVIGPQGEVYVLYYRDLGSASALYVAKSSDGGLTFPQVVRATDVTRPPSPLVGSSFRVFVLPSLAVDPASGALYATWNDYSSGDTDVKLVASSDGGVTWTSPSRIGRDTGKADQFFPAAVVGAGGTLHLLWLDRRDDTANKRYIPYYARTTDGGKTLLAEFPLSSTGSSPDIGFEGTLIGDYLGLDVSADGKRVYAAWVDTRNGDQDIFFASFDATTASGPPPSLPAPRATVRPLPPLQPSPQPLTAFTHEAFRSRWERADKPILNAKAARPWTWGPVSFAAAFEEYAQGRNGQREVQYFDKARMEINNPETDPTSRSFVTNGLLVVELISGIVQTGDNEFAQPRSPSAAPVAGDADSPDALTYTSLASVASLQGDKRVSDKTGQPISAVLARSGAVREDPSRAGPVKLGRYEAITGHNIADIFWSYLTSDGPVYNSRFGNYQNEPVLDWLSDVGYPISEPYWTTAKVNGTQKWVLVQAFQRRVLTYVADNPVGWQVEMGNVGRHYFDWRYNEQRQGQGTAKR